jgi:hypothetical protein
MTSCLAGVQRDVLPLRLLDHRAEKIDRGLGRLVAGDDVRLELRAEPVVFAFLVRGLAVLVQGGFAHQRLAVAAIEDGGGKPVPAGAEIDPDGRNLVRRTLAEVRVRRPEIDRQDVPSVRHLSRTFLTRPRCTIRPPKTTAGRSTVTRSPSVMWPKVSYLLWRSVLQIMISFS